MNPAPLLGGGTAPADLAAHRLVRLEVHHPRPVPVMLAFAGWAGVDRDTAEAAIANVRSGAATGLLMSGPMASGKDTVCDAVLPQVGLATTHCRVAHAIRAEIDVAIAAMRAAVGAVQAADDIAAELGVDASTAAFYVAQLFDAVRADAAITAETRTPAMRTVLQWHGAEGRADQPGYWVRIAYQRIIPLLAEGVSVHLTDGRFAGEVDAGRVMGLYCVRLWAPEAERVRRIAERDGIDVDRSALRHPGEIGLDGYWGLDLEVDNSGDFDDVVGFVAGRFDAHRERIVSGA